MSDHYETRCPSCGGSDEQGCYADCPTHHITALEARVRELERALTEIEKRDRFYTNRKYINAATIVVEDRGRYNVLVLGNLGKIARAALNQEKQK